MKQKQKTEKVSLTSISKSIDDLAVATKNGFDEMGGELRGFQNEMTDFRKKTEITLFNLDSHARTTNERLNAIEKILEPLMLVSGAMQHELREHDRRLLHVEQKVGLVNK